MAKATKTPKTGGKSGNSSQSFILLFLGILAIGGMWVYGVTGIFFGILGIRYAKKNSKAANSSVGKAGKIFSIIGLLLSILYLIAWGIVLFAQWK